jgi:hypothetical protein
VDSEPKLHTYDDNDRVVVAWHEADLATALFEYPEIFHNRRRRHSPLGMLTPFEFENHQGSPATSTPASTVA